MLGQQFHGFIVVRDKYPTVERMFICQSQQIIDSFWIPKEIVFCHSALDVARIARNVSLKFKQEQRNLMIDEAADHAERLEIAADNHGAGSAVRCRSNCTCLSFQLRVRELNL